MVSISSIKFSWRLVSDVLLFIISAVAMCKFARDCLAKMHLLIKELEPELGPDTCESQS